MAILAVTELCGRETESGESRRQRKQGGANCLYTYIESTPRNEWGQWHFLIFQTLTKIAVPTHETGWVVSFWRYSRLVISL
jgi:hypothetical protein